MGFLLNCSLLYIQVHYLFLFKLQVCSSVTGLTPVHVTFWVMVKMTHNKKIMDILFLFMNY